MKRIFIATALAACTAGCMYSSNTTRLTVNGDRNTIRTAAGAQDKPINAGVDAALGDAAIDAAYTLAGAGTGAVVAGAPGAAVGAAGGWITSQVVNPADVVEVK